VEQFVLLADASDKVPDLTNNRSYADFQLSKKEWDKLEVIHEVLRVCTAKFILFRHICNPFFAGTGQCTTNLLERAHAHRLAYHPVSRVPDKTLGIDGSAASLS
jgi:hypothetical protein